ncbi:class I SAM-dependent methyltransferase [bacterium]|nr:class I SAM-dependent methyltransferase [bacterium]
MFDFNKATENVGGWLTEAEGLSLYNIAKKIKTGNVIVEVGSWKGKSTICLGNGSRDANKVKIFAVDPHIGSSEHQKMFGKVDTFEEFKQNINKAGVAEYVEPVRDTSENAAKNFNQKIEFAFIDGAHEYSFVKLDFNLWFSKVMNGGFLAFHDSWHFIGPNLATAIPLLTSSRIKNPRLVDTITYFEKVERNSFLNRLENIGFIIYRTLFGIRGFFRLKYQGSRVI